MQTKQEKKKHTKEMGDEGVIESREEPNKWKVLDKYSRIRKGKVVSCILLVISCSCCWQQFKNNLRKCVGESNSSLFLISL
jgi:hypothetical protein